MERQPPIFLADSSRAVSHGDVADDVVSCGWSGHCQEISREVEESRRRVRPAGGLVDGSIDSYNMKLK